MSIPFKEVNPDTTNVTEVCQAASEMLRMGLCLTEAAMAIGWTSADLVEAMVRMGYQHPTTVWREGRRREAKLLLHKFDEGLAAKVAAVKPRTLRRWKRLA